MKKRFRKNNVKRGVSPLIATILLVGFTVSIVTLTILWSSGYVQERAQKEDKLAEARLNCENIKFTVIEAYQSGSELFMTLENQAITKIDAFILRIYGDTGEVEAVDLRQNLKELETKKVNLGTADFDVGVVQTITTVDIIPQIKAGKATYVPCSGKHIETRMTR
ncbi:MAG: hypothetical protein KKA65_00610 [Nanoarchaeota archaeon]|nr:hypothetical protein [Nanoarchaeota archaeon]MBU4352380.1 hypothetical protein [Nanoarchaeota archaeon]MBU4455980.1 hypothetical protein [Nanoarchaeota archaeon]MCG2719870.1 hypothetical protein [Nanoarchaeota archaeon]